MHRSVRALLLSLCFVSSAAGADTSVPFSPVMSSPTFANRRALIIIPALAGTSTNPRGALALSDARAYRDTLRLLGFSGAVVAAETRLALRSAIKGFVDGLPRDAEVAVFVLGASVPAGGRLYVPPSDLSPDDRTPAHIASAGLDLGEILRGIADRGPKEFVAIVDECGGGEAKPACEVGPAMVPDGVSAIVVHRVPSGGSGGPVAGVATARQDLMPLMREQGLDFLQLYTQLKARLEGTNDGLSTTAALSRNFVFLPNDFLASLPLECNRVDPGVSAEKLLHSPSMAPLVTSCERAAAAYDVTPRFQARLTAVREQLAFQKAVAGCAGTAASTYRDAYPDGAYRFALAEHESACERQRQPPPAPAPTPSPPPPEPEAPSLSSRALGAVATYYERHGYTAGDGIGALASLYPPFFFKRDGQVSRDRHIAELSAYYAQLTSLRFFVLASTLDYSGCDAASSCLVRGTVQSTYVKPGGAPRSGLSRFSLRFDLDRGKVLYECAVVQGRTVREAPCE